MGVASGMHVPIRTIQSCRDFQPVHKFRGGNDAGIQVFLVRPGTGQAGDFFIFAANFCLNLATFGATMNWQ